MSDVVEQLRELERAATPGPWERLAGDEGRRVMSQSVRVLLGERGTIVCRVESNDPRHHADAALIVALRNRAPAILRVLKAARAWQEWRWADDPTPLGPLDHEIAAALNALDSES